MKLDDLCAIKVMGWELVARDECSGRPTFIHREEDCIKARNEYWNPGNFPYKSKADWNPSTNLSDALVCLERAAQGKGYPIYMFPEEKKPYDVELEVFKVCTDAKTLPLAMCICALRAMGVPESEIQEAMK